MLDMNKIMEEWRCLIPIFHSERDFQQALVRMLHKDNESHNNPIFSEYPLHRLSLGYDNRERLDIWYEDKRIAIELKYRTLKLDRKLTINGATECFELTNQAAQNIARYQFLADVRRLEELQCKQRDLKGYAIFLTNDKKFWELSPKSWRCPHEIRINKDAQFHLHEGRIINGKLDWARGRGKGCAKGRPPINLTGCYKANWQCYPNTQDEDNALFKYLAFQVPSPES